MAILDHLVVFLVPALFLLAFLGLASKYVYKWMREGYEAETADHDPASE